MELCFVVAISLSQNALCVLKSYRQTTSFPQGVRTALWDGALGEGLFLWGQREKDPRPVHKRHWALESPAIPANLVPLRNHMKASHCLVQDCSNRVSWPFAKRITLHRTPMPWGIQLARCSRNQPSRLTPSRRGGYESTCAEVFETTEAPAKGNFLQSYSTSSLCLW